MCDKLFFIFWVFHQLFKNIKTIFSLGAIKKQMTRWVGHSLQILALNQKPFAVLNMYLMLSHLSTRTPAFSSTWNGISHPYPVLPYCTHLAPLLSPSQSNLLSSKCFHLCPPMALIINDLQYVVVQGVLLVYPHGTEPGTVSALITVS